MHYKMKYLIIWICTTIIIVNTCNFTWTASAEDAEMSAGEKVKHYIQEQAPTTNEEITEVQSDVVLQYENLMTACAEGEVPDCYAGSYLKQGELVVKVTDDSQKILDELRKVLGSEEIVIETAEYSYDSLQEAYDYIYEIAKSEEYKNNITDLVGFKIDEEHNCVMVYIENLTKEKQTQFEKIFDYDERYEYENGYAAVRTSNSYVVQPGYQLKNSSGGMLSAGYRAYWTNPAGTKYYGFVTAAHCIANALTVYTPEGVLVGVCEKKLDDSGKGIDAAFVRIVNPNFSASNTVLYKNSSGTSGGVTLAGASWVTSIALNTTLYKSGYRTYLTSGSITGNSTTWLVEGQFYNDLIETKSYVLPGDSGGCAYILYGTEYVKAGIVFGAAYSSTTISQSTFYRSYFVKASNIYNELKIVPY